MRSQVRRHLSPFQWWDTSSLRRKANGVRVKKLDELTDRQISQLMGALHGENAGKRSELIASAAYRLVRAGGGPLTKDESKNIDDIHTCDFRLREAEREQRRARGRKGRPRAHG